MRFLLVSPLELSEYTFNNKTLSFVVFFKFVLFIRHRTYTIISQMIKKISTLLAIFIGISGPIFSQDDPVLFAVNERSVKVSEFEYIYTKNNGEKADYSEESLNEYLDLYVKFKLKVEQAKSMGLDTVQRLQNELAGYRKQLASSYLVDKEVSEKLIDQVVDRMKTDVEVSHIFVSNPPNSKPGSAAEAEKKINAIYEDLERGKKFDEVAKRLSEDKKSGMKGGKLGFYVSMLPAGFYQFENAMYETPIGEYAKPIKSKMGYHIIKVESHRPARGEMEVSHILLKKTSKQAKVKIDSIYKELKSGQDFGKLATMYSEDPNTNTKAGYLGFFKINKYDRRFEDAAFALRNDRDFSEPIETEFGWHIIKRHSVKSTDDEAKLRRKIQGTITKDERFEAAKKELVNKIKKQTNLKENQIALAKFTSKLDEEFYSYKWRVPEDLEDEDLLVIGNNYKKSIRDFAEFCKKDTRSRLRFTKTEPLDSAVASLYERYVDDRMLAYEEANLANKYPEFKSLMREYEEGILLFEATKIEVWDKASSDSIGLADFYQRNKDNYKWNERVEVEEYTLMSADETMIKKLLKKSKKLSSAELLTLFNVDGKEILKVSDSVMEQSPDEAPLLGKIGTVVPGKVENDSYTFKKIKNIIPATNKTLKEARGYIIADYQDELEKEWIETLKAKFKVSINKDVFNSLVKRA